MLLLVGCSDNQSSPDEVDLDAVVDGFDTAEDGVETRPDATDTRDIEDPCSDVEQCDQVGATCIDGVASICSEDARGCLVGKIVDCGENGGVCVEANGSAMCRFTRTEMICDDGNDDDGDGATDCDDLDCEGDTACAPTEVCDDGVDNDMDGATDCVDLDCNGEPVCGSAEVCDDGVDNDMDGATDCADAECLGKPACMSPAEVCDDGVDNDMDGDVDCSDADCASASACRLEICTDGIDNDGDGDADCADSSCASDPSCGAEACDDGIDNDGDGQLDCADTDCALGPMCFESACTDAIDNDGDGDTDCADADCSIDVVCEPVESSCGDGFDNDGDGQLDCADADCATARVCIEVCTDGGDNDGDGRVDCADADCSSLPVCLGQSITSMTGCDPTYCVLLPSGSDNGHDLCRCTLPALNHPDVDDIELTPCNFDGGEELFVELDFTATSYTHVAATTCTETADNSIIAFFDVTNQIEGSPLVCDNNAGGQIDAYCSIIEPTPLPASRGVVLVIDENQRDDYWDDMTDRIFEFEMLTVWPTEAGHCTDGADSDLDGFRDCEDPDCAADPVCGPEVCDDGFENDGDRAIDCDDADCIAAPVCASGFPQPLAGEVVITEIMFMPAEVGGNNFDAHAEWIELYNPTNHEIDLQNCELSSSGSMPDLFVAPLVMAPGSYVTLAPSAALSGVSPAFIWDNFGPLGDTGDTIEIRCGSTVVDTVTYSDMPPWPMPVRARSFSLEPSSLDAVINDSGFNWCRASEKSPNYVNRALDVGTPGMPNPPCLPEDEVSCTDGLDDDADGMIDCFDPSCFTDMACISGLSPPNPGELVFTEIMYDSASPGDVGGGEWVELYNPTPMALDLKNCAFVKEISGQLQTETFTTTFVAPPGEFLTLAKSSSAGFTPDWVYQNLSFLSDTSSTLYIVCDAIIIDQVLYSRTAPWPAPPPGTAINLDPMSFDAASNDAGGYWCAATVAISTGDLGTPGAANTTCSAP